MRIFQYLNSEEYILSISHSAGKYSIFYAWCIIYLLFIPPERTCVRKFPLQKGFLDCVFKLYKSIAIERIRPENTFQKSFSAANSCFLCISLSQAIRHIRKLMINILIWDNLRLMVIKGEKSWIIFFPRTRVAESTRAQLLFWNFFSRF